MELDKDWQKQQATLEYYKKNNPELVKNKIKKTEAEIFEEIGIFNIPENRDSGYIRLFPNDFIVEEKNKNCRVAKVNSINSSINSDTADGSTLFADLIKVGIPTSLAIERVAQAFNIKPARIGYAGLKDADALTAQSISIPEFKMPISEIEKVKIPNIYLNNFFYSKKPLLPGDLAANIFTITVRTQKPINEGIFRNKINLINNYGVLNYFQSQRFRTLRLISHKLGKLIFQGKYEFAIKYFLFKTSEEDIDLISNIRKEAEKNYPDFDRLTSLYSEMPYTFPFELRIINYLRNYPEDYLGALEQIKEQTQLWIYAYSSLLFNKHLSEYSMKNGVVDEKFPILLSDDPNDIKIYNKYLVEDETTDFLKHLRPFRFIQRKKRMIEGRIFPENLNYRSFGGGVVLNFSLNKGSYATTLLANLFEIFESLPIPEWVDIKQIDAKAILGQGDIKNIKEILKEYFYSKMDNQNP